MALRTVRNSIGHENLKSQTFQNKNLSPRKKTTTGESSNRRPLPPPNDHHPISPRPARNGPRADTVTKVADPQPHQYWLGRLVTLINAFHYEDSFNSPDISTGFGMLSSFSRPLGHPNSNEAGYRIKRAFMVLENVCTTNEASRSLRDFRDEYIKKMYPKFRKRHVLASSVAPNMNATHLSSTLS
ncbi:hypothetical protein FE257_002134 [Aspergillus nanangensis]|uniref:Uncharacterized protein n=1 Tax=Aspergillus nanangensis TaxID=2582783 RepID=A0AAD4CTU0_ASPNN|nr:hypothetical protein FE257_002134 [Aspergillus nanangensis]